MLKVAIPKGELFRETVESIRAAGYDVGELASGENGSRKLYLECGPLAFILSRPSDVPTYVEYGAADVGITGKDVLLEAGRDVVELLDLGYGFCRFVVAAPVGAAERLAESYEHLGEIRVATKFPEITEAFFREKGLQVEIIKLKGSVELAPRVGLAELIVDLTATGRTLAENDLAIVEEVVEVSARLVANYVSYRLKFQEVNEFMERLASARAARDA